MNHYDKHVYRGGNHQINIPYVSFRRRVNVVLFVFVCLFAPCNARCRSTGPNIKCTYFHIVDIGWFYNKRECHGHNDQATGDINTVHQCIQTSLNLFESVKVRKGVSLVEINSDHSVAPGRQQVIIWPKDGFVFISITRVARLNGLTMDIKPTDYRQSTSVFLLSVWLISCFQKSWYNYVQINVVIATVAHLMPSGFFVLFKEHYFSNVTRSHYHIIYRNAVVSSGPFY